MEDLWKQYENLKKDQDKTSRYHQSKQKTKYYYYNHEKVTEEEFRAKTSQNYRAKAQSSASFGPDFVTYCIDKNEWNFYERRLTVEHVVMGLGALFFFAVILSLYPSTWWMLIFVSLSLIALGLGVWLVLRSPLENLVIEIHPDRIIRRGKGLLETTIYYRDLATIQVMPLGIYLHKEAGREAGILSHRTLATSDHNTIFIPIALQNFNLIRQFFIELSPHIVR